MNTYQPTQNLKAPTSSLRASLKRFHVDSCMKTIWQKTSLYLGLRSRYLVTTSSAIRVRYTLPCLVVTAFFAASVIHKTFPVSHYDKADLSAILASIEPAAGAQISMETSHLAAAVDATPVSLSSTVEEALPRVTPKTINMAAASELPESFYRNIEKIKQSEPVEIELQSGQTVTGQLTNIGISSNDAYQIMEALRKYQDPHQVRAGQSFKIEFDPKAPQGEYRTMAKMTMPVSAAKQIVVYRTGDQVFQAKQVEKEIKKSYAAARAELKYSLYGSAAKAGIPDEVIANFIKIYSWNVDFQRDIRAGDEIELLYEINELQDGTVTGYGDIIYARLIVSGRDIPLYRFQTQDGLVDYFDRDGTSIRRTLMKTPIDGARMSSGFGMRRHPVLGYSKMHRGLDFAAPTGTPIYAAGDAVVDYAGRFSTFGNYIRLKHNGTLKTAYAHLSRIKPSVKVGTRVKQGEVIGYVGTTGRSTGPHLHYEILINDNHVDPRGVNIPTGEQLKGDQFNKFKSQRRKFDQEYAALTKGADYAMLPEEKTDNTSSN